MLCQELCLLKIAATLTFDNRGTTSVSTWIPENWNCPQIQAQQIKLVCVHAHVNTQKWAIVHPKQFKN